MSYTLLYNSAVVVAIIVWSVCLRDTLFDTRDYVHRRHGSYQRISVFENT